MGKKTQTLNQGCSCVTHTAPTGQRPRPKSRCARNLCNLNVNNYFSNNDSKQGVTRRIRHINETMTLMLDDSMNVLCHFIGHFMVNVLTILEDEPTFYSHIRPCFLRSFRICFARFALSRLLRRMAQPPAQVSHGGAPRMGTVNGPHPGTLKRVYD